MGEMRVLTEQGDITVEWDPKDAASVEKAEAEFDRLKKDGYKFYEVEETRGKPVSKFSKTLGKLLAAPGARTKADKKAGGRQHAMSGGPTAQAQRSR